MLAISTEAQFTSPDSNSYKAVFPIQPTYNKDSIAEDELSFLPIFTTHDISPAEENSNASIRNNNKKVTKVYIAIHGMKGAAGDVFNKVREGINYYSFKPKVSTDDDDEEVVLGNKQIPNNIAIIVPYLGKEVYTIDSWVSPSPHHSLSSSSSSASSKNHNTINSNSIHWNNDDWISSGNDSLNITSTFDILNAFIVSCKLSFPNVELLSFVGFSAGGQVVGHYSWAKKDEEVIIDGGGMGSNILLSSFSSSKLLAVKSEDDRQITYTPKPKLQIRFIVGDPSSFLYLSHYRPNPQTCCRLRDTKSMHSCGSFVGPETHKYHETCKEYDKWKYGIGSFEKFATHPYFQVFFKSVDDSQARVRRQTEIYKSRDVRFVFGTSDVCNCNTIGYKNNKSCFKADDVCFPLAISASEGCCDSYPDSKSNNDVAVNCESMAQGSNRLQRGLNYMDYLVFYFGLGNYTPRFELLESLAHNDKMFYHSDTVSKFALDFEDDIITKSQTTLRIIQDDKRTTWYDAWTDSINNSPGLLTWWGDGGGPLLFGCCFVIFISYFGCKWLFTEVRERREKRRRAEWEIEKMVIDENSPLL